MPTTAQRTQDLVSSIGFDTQLAAPGAGAGYADASTVLSQLQYVGATSVREVAPGSVSPQQAAEAGQLAAGGIKFDFMVPDNGPVDLTAEMALLDAFAASHPGAIVAVEGPNEVDLWPVIYAGQSGIPGAIALQRDLYTAVHADPSLAGVPVYDFSLGTILPADDGVGNIAAYADAANVHAYAANGIRPSWVIPAAIQGFGADVPGKPTVVTETGYYTLPNDSNWGGVNEAVQAIYGTDTALDDFKNGVVSTYFYELDDAAVSADREDNFGAFRADGSAKPFATALHNLTTLVADPAPKAFTPGTLDITFGNLPWTASSLVLQKSTGVFDVAVWDEQALWDPNAHQQLASTTSQTTIHLGMQAATVAVYDVITGTTAIAHYTNTQDITLALSSDPLLIEITQTVTPPAPTALYPTIAAITVTGSGTTLSGTSAANSTVVVTDTAAGKTTTFGTVVTSSTGAWSLTSHAAINAATVNTFNVKASNAAGLTGKMNGALILDSTGRDTLTSAATDANVFAVDNLRGADVINGFKVSGSIHDVIDVDVHSFTSFSQIQSALTGSGSAVIHLGSSKTITLTGVDPHALTSSDFRFS